MIKQVTIIYNDDSLEAFDTANGGGAFAHYLEEINDRGLMEWITLDNQEVCKLTAEKDFIAEFLTELDDAASVVIHDKNCGTMLMLNDMFPDVQITALRALADIVELTMKYNKMQSE